MDEITKSRIYDYVHTTLSMVEGDREAIWNAAIKLSKLKLEDVSVRKFKRIVLRDLRKKLGLKKAIKLSAEIIQELLPLIDCVRDPGRYFQINRKKMQEAQKVILEIIGSRAASFKTSPPKALPEIDLKEIAAKQQNKINAVKERKPTTSSHNVDRITDTELDEEMARNLQQSYDLESDQYLPYQMFERISNARREVLSLMEGDISTELLVLNYLEAEYEVSQLSMQALFSVVNFMHNLMLTAASFIQNHPYVEYAFVSLSLATEDSALTGETLMLFNTLRAYSALFSNIRPQVYQYQEDMTDDVEHIVTSENDAVTNNSFYGSLSDAVQTVSNQAYALWESTVGISVANNVSSMWRRTTAQASRLLQSDPGEEIANRRRNV